MLDRLLLARLLANLLATAISEWLTTSILPQSCLSHTSRLASLRLVI